MSRRFLLAALLPVLLATPAVAQRRNNPAGGNRPNAPAAANRDSSRDNDGRGRAYWRTIREPRIECRAAVQYLNWQWNRYAGPGPVPQGSPITGMANPHNQQALTDLIAGVAHNQQAVGVYRSCVAASSIEYLMWVAATTSERSCDMAAVTTNLSWQKQNALPTLNEAIRHWQAGRDAKTVAEENNHALLAVREMYAAVRHNATASAVYRACFRDRPEDFFQAVRLMLDS